MVIVGDAQEYPGGAHAGEYLYPRYDAADFAVMTEEVLAYPFGGET